MKKKVPDCFRDQDRHPESEACRCCDDCPFGVECKEPLFRNVSGPPDGYASNRKVSPYTYAVTAVREIRHQLSGHRAAGVREDPKKKDARVSAATKEARRLISSWLIWARNCPDQ